MEADPSHLFVIKIKYQKLICAEKSLLQLMEPKYNSPTS